MKVLGGDLDSGTKPVVLLLTQVYLPGFLAGGPVRSIAGLVANLSSEFDWKIITTNRDLGSNDPYGEILADCWIEVDGAKVRYLSAGKDRVFDIVRLIRETPHDLLYVNSFFNPRFSIAPVIAHKLGLLSGSNVLVAPRGEFSLGALSIKRLKKSLYLRFSRIFGIYDNVYWHASAAHESKDILRELGTSTNRVSLGLPLKYIGVAADLSSKLPAQNQEPLPASKPLRVCFLSRVARMKNLDFALRALALVREPVVFSIYGPKEDLAYWRECVALISKLPSHVTVTDGGSVPAQDVPAVLAAQDLLFLPTLGENFGHVIVESWSVGLPVLISDRTQWRGLRTQGVGWDLSIDMDSEATFASVIDEIATLPSSEFVSIRRRAIQKAEAACNNSDAVASNRKMFLTASGRITSKQRDGLDDVV